MQNKGNERQNSNKSSGNKLSHDTNNSKCQFCTMCVTQFSQITSHYVTLKMFFIDFGYAKLGKFIKADGYNL